MATRGALTSVVVTALAVAAAAFPSGAAAQSPPEFANWLTVDGDVASGSLLGGSITLSGSNVPPPPASVVDESSPEFDRDVFTPRLGSSDAIYFSGFPGF